ncbi:hypothetical protein [Pseudonocardia acaciae]|uniref:hypothetical protein n=1 Tax=Pseudonocardia acaciae TaxID=551276 RepID=UPI00048F67AA|nr:hypothetical protein [Pseudonocardia acaciae]
MTGTIVVVLIILAIIAGIVWLAKQRAKAQQRELDDAKSEARRWVERLGGSVLNLQGTNEASMQAMADASERYNAAGSQLDQAKTVPQCRQVTETAYEGLYYVRAARTAMNLDPGPELPALPGQQRAGSVTEAREVDVEGHHYSAAPVPSDRNSHYYPGGMVNGRPVPSGWYSEPWWKTALVAGAAGIGSFLLMDALFSGMHGTAYADGFHDAQAMGAGDMGGADMGGGDFGGGDWGGGDFGGGDFGGGDF